MKVPSFFHSMRAAVAASLWAEQLSSAEFPRMASVSCGSTVNQKGLKGCAAEPGGVTEENRTETLVGRATETICHVLEQEHSGRRAVTKIKLLLSNNWSVPWSLQLMPILIWIVFNAMPVHVFFSPVSKVYIWCLLQTPWSENLQSWHVVSSNLRSKTLCKTLKKIKMQSVLQVLPNQCGNILHVFYKWWSSTHPGLWTTESFEDAPRIQSWNLIIRSLVNNESIYLWNQILQHSQSSVDPVPTSLILVDGMKFSVSIYL